MEPAGLADGIVGLAGLFSTCLKVIDRVQLYRSFNSDSRDLSAQFAAHSIRFERWGQYVGFDQDGQLRADHHCSLNDRGIFMTIKGLLNVIAFNLKHVEHSIFGKRLVKLSKPQHEATVQVDTSQPVSPNAQSRWHKVAWAVRGRAEQIDKTDLLGSIVQQLHDLIPVDHESLAFSAFGINMASITAAIPIQGTTCKINGLQVTNNPLGAPTADQFDFMELREAIARLEKESQAERQQDLRSWIMGDMSTSDVYEDSLQRRLEKTCDWIFDRPQYLEWVSPEFEGDRPKLLWIYGPAGFGKTVLCSQITKHVSSLLESQSTLTAHFFLSADLGSREDPFVIIRSWISQIIASEDHAFRLSMDEKQSQQSKTASRTSILNLLSRIVQALPRCTLIVDGLDECMSSVVEFLSSLKRAVAGSSTRLLIVSRDEGDIREALTVNNAGQLTFSEYRVTSADTEADIAMYSRSIVDDKLSNKTSAVKDDISEKMAQRCEGQFLWLKLQGDGLRRGMNKKQLQNTVNETPIGLDRVYSKNWEKITALPDGTRDRAIALLRWATFAVRPLTVREMTEAVLIDLENDADGLPIDPDELPDAVDQDYIDTEIMGLCFSLLEVRLSTSESDSSTGSRTIHLTHFSVKEFLLPNLISAANVPRGLPLVGTSAAVKDGETSMHALLARLCLHYIEFPRIWKQTNPTEASAESDEVAELRPGGFQDYAAMSWPRHHALSSNTGEDPDYVTSLFDRAHPVWDLWTDWQDRKQGLRPEWLKEEKDTQAPGPLYYAAHVGFPRLVQYLLKRGEDAREASAKGRSAIAAASVGGFPEIVKILLDAGSKVAVPNVFGNAPIHGAVYRGNVETVKLLLDHGADPTVENGEGITPLIMACKGGFTDIAKLLLEADVDPHQRNKSGANATHYASGFGQAEALKLLLERGVKINVRGAEKHRPIHLASQYGHDQVVKLLIAHGARVNDRMDDGWSPLHWASTNGHAEVVKLLLQAGAPVDAILLSCYYTPLIMACTSGHLEVVKILIGAGATMNWETAWDGWTALTVAVNNGYMEVVEYLIGLGADVNYAPQGTLSWHPLHLAASKGNKEMLQLLLAHGADLKLKNRYSEVPYHVALFCKQVEMAELLIDMGMDVDYSGKDGQTPLHWAGEEDKIDMVEFLIRKGANLEARDAGDQTPLHTASMVGKSAFVNLLIRKGAKLKPVDKDNHMPIHLAALQGHANVVSLLIDHGVSPNGHPGPSHTPLSYSALAGHADVIALLLDRGADIDRADTGNNTPLHLAAYGEKPQAAEILLDRGANIDHKNSSGWTPLHQAISEKNLDVAKLLIQRGADLQSVDNKGLKPLELAFGPGHECKQDLALPWPRNLDSKKAKLSILGIVTHSLSDKLRRNWWLIHYAAAAGDMDTIEILLRKGEDIDTESMVGGVTPLTLALLHRKFDTAKRLLERGANVNGTPSQRDICPLLLATGCGIAAAAQLVLEKGADVEAREAKGRSPFFLACDGGYLDVAKVLCQYTRENPEASAAGPPGTDGIQRSGLFAAALWGHHTVVDYLCYDDRVNITETDWAGNSALVAAAAGGHAEAVQILLSHCTTWAAPRSEAATLLWKKAKGSRQPDVMRLVAGYLRGQDPDFDEESIGDVDAAPKQARNGGFCDACLLTIPAGENSWKCGECLGGCFCVCTACFKSGRRCLDRRHGRLTMPGKKIEKKLDKKIEKKNDERIRDCAYVESSDESSDGESRSSSSESTPSSRVGTDGPSPTR